MRQSLPVDEARPRNQARAKQIARDYSRLPGRMIFAAGLLFALAMFWQAVPGNRHESRHGDSLAAASLTSTVDNQTSSAAPHAVGIQTAAFGPALPEAPLVDEVQPVDSATQSLPLHLAGNSVGREPRPPTIRHGRFLRITSVRLGQRLIGKNPIREQAELIEPDPETWRQLSLSMGKSDGGRLWIELLRPVAWIEQQQATVGGEIYLDLKELGAVGWATVNAILPCPEIEPGDGTVVTGTFKHQANEQTRVLRLALEGQAERTGVTDNHPYWSVDRQAFIPAGELLVGETVDTVFGERRVKSLTPIAPDDPSFDGYLYNLETTEHVYRVGTLATLVHNVYTGDCLVVKRIAAQEAIEEGSLSVFRPRSAVIKAASDAEHHIFTKARSKWFERRYGIDVDDFVVDVDDLIHQALHAGKSALNNKAGWWDHELITRIRDAEAIFKRKLTRDEVLEIGQDMLKRFGLDQLPIHAYSK